MRIGVFSFAVIMAVTAAMADPYRPQEYEYTHPQAVIHNPSTGQDILVQFDGGAWYDPRTGAVIDPYAQEDKAFATALEALIETAKLDARIAGVEQDVEVLAKALDELGEAQGGSGDGCDCDARWEANETAHQTFAQEILAIDDKFDAARTDGDIGVIRHITVENDRLVASGYHYRAENGLLTGRGNEVVESVPLPPATVENNNYYYKVGEGEDATYEDVVADVTEAVDANIAGAYVPYSGAVNDVDLGFFSLLAIGCDIHSIDCGTLTVNERSDFYQDIEVFGETSLDSDTTIGGVATMTGGAVIGTGLTLDCGWDHVVTDSESLPEFVGGAIDDEVESATNALHTAISGELETAVSGLSARIDEIVSCTCDRTPTAGTLKWENGGFSIYTNGVKAGTLQFTPGH